MHAARASLRTGKFCSLGSSGTGSDVDKVAEATWIVREREPDLAIDGPLQYDAAAIASVGHSKRPGSAVAGRASVFVFPDLDTGNTTYQAVQRSAQVVSVGPMLQGLAKPVNDLSRGALVDDIVYTLALTAAQSCADSCWSARRSSGWAGHAACEAHSSRKLLLAHCVAATAEVTIHMDGKEMARSWWTDGSR